MMNKKENIRQRILKEQEQREIKSMTGTPDISPISREVAKYKRKEFNYQPGGGTFANYTYQWMHKRNMKVLRVKEELMDEVEKENTGYPELSRGTRQRMEQTDYKGPFLGYYERLQKKKKKEMYGSPSHLEQKDRPLPTPAINNHSRALAE